MQPLHILIGLLLCAAVPRTVARPSTVDRTVHVVFVEPAGEEFTLAEQADAWASVQHAIDYWETLSPITTALELAEPVLITSTASMTGSLLRFE